MDNYHALLTKAMKAYQNGQFDNSEKMTRQLIELDPQNFDTQFLSAMLSIARLDHLQAISHFCLALMLTDETKSVINIHLKIAQCYEHIEDFKLAITSYKIILKKNQTHAFSLFGLAQNHTVLGNKKDALDAYLKTIDYTEINQHAYIRSISFLAISELESDTKINTRLSKIIDNEITLCLDLNARATLYFALANLYEKQQLFDKAFENYRQGNAIKNQLQPYHHKTVEEHAIKAIGFFDANLFRTVNSSSLEQNKLIFIVGLPRSGSTLIESLLACSNRVHAGGETSHIPQIINSLNTTGHYPQIINNLRENDIKQLARQYLSFFDNTNKTTFTDKLPANFWNIGLIKLMFPAAKIIHCYKHPVSSCLSLFRQNFQQGHPYSYSLEQCADYYDTHQQLMNHWMNLFPKQILQVNYEQFIANPEQQSKRIFDYCGLNWRGEYLHNYQSRTSVRTASAFQIRTDIHSTNAQRLKNYHCQLKSLTERYKNYSWQLFT